MKPEKTGPTQVLIVDDEPDFVEPVLFWLKSKGYEVISVSNGPDALKAVRQHRPDMIFLDIQMPEMDGIETLRRIRAISKTIPVVMVTAVYQDSKSFAAATKLGISGFFPKQSSLPELIKIIETTLRTHAKLRKGTP